MTFTIAAKELKKAVSLLAPLAGTYGYIALGEYGAYAVNGGIKIVLSFGFGFDNEPPAIVFAKPLAELFRATKIKADEVEITIDADFVVLKSGRSRFKLTRVSANVMQELVAPDDNSPCISMRKAAFEMLIDRVRYAAANGKDDARPGLQGIHVHSDGGKLVSAATNGHRLARYAVVANLSEVTVPELGPLALTIGNDAVSHIRKFLEYVKPDSDLSFVVDESRAELQTEYGAITFTLIDGQFPDYQRLLPEMEHGIELDTVEFGKAIDAMLEVVPEDKKIMATFDVEGEVKLYAGWCGAEAENTLDYDGVYPVSTSVFNGSYMMQAIEPCECRIQFSATGPILLQGLCDTEYKAAVMPMRA